MITIELPWPDKRLSPNARVHWRVKAESTKIAKSLGEYGVLEITTIWPPDKAPSLIKPLPDELIAQYIFHPPDKRKRDMDNFLAMMKPYLDGVCSAIGIDDSRIKRTVLEWGEVVKGGKVVLTLEEMK